MRVVIVHGTGGSPSINWFPWLKNQLECRSISVLVPRFPTPDGQSLNAWLSTFRGEIGEVGPDDVLIGHSTGVPFVCRVLEQSSRSVKAAFLVAGFARPIGHPELDPLIATFLDAPFDWATIRGKARQFFVYSGENDPYVPSHLGAEVASALAVEHRIIPNGRHLNQECGFTELPFLLKDLELLQSQQNQPQLGRLA